MYLEDGSDVYGIVHTAAVRSYLQLARCWRLPNGQR